MTKHMNTITRGVKMASIGLLSLGLLAECDMPFDVTDGYDWHSMLAAPVGLIILTCASVPISRCRAQADTRVQVLS